jgi:hypothetical protein
MDDKINHMKPENIHSAKFIIQSKAQDKTMAAISLLKNAVYAMLYFRPGK